MHLKNGQIEEYVGFYWISSGLKFSEMTMKYKTNKISTPKCALEIMGGCRL